MTKMDHAKMLTLLKCILEEYREHNENVSQLVAVADGPEDKERWEAMQTTARNCVDALSQVIALLSQN